MDYSFGINNFHAIGNAEISLKGITVLAGINGCGKSTIARSLFSLINSMSEYETIQQKRFCKILASEILKARNLSLPFETQWGQILPKFLGLLKQENDFASSIHYWYFAVLENIIQALHDRQSDNDFLARASIYLLEETLNDRGADYLISRYRQKCTDFFSEQLDLMHQKINDRTIDNLNKIIRQEFPDCESTIGIATFKENGISLLSGNEFLPTLLNRAIYVDTPMVLGMENVGNLENKSIWGRFHRLMFEKNTDILQDEDKIFKLQIILRTVLGGNIVEANDFGLKVLHYKSNDGLDINIKQTATGIKSFAYILRLLENGWLNSNSLLIIDEPEAHLHPQWVVEFAKVLVLLQKELGVKILVASHAPDMVAAIHDMSEYYKLSDKTDFYVAKEKEGESGKFDYINLGNEIGGIFEQFNIALEKIGEYSVEE